MPGCCRELCCSRYRISRLAQKKYDPGASDTAIKIGNLAPYSGPASAFAQIAKTQAAYFTKINAEGGINGRKIVFVSYDDNYSPPKAFEHARKLVEDDEVLLIFNPLGTAQNSAIQRYLNGKRVPQLFVASSATKWNDPKNFAWTMGYGPSAQSEGRVYARYLLDNHSVGQDRRALSERRLRKGLSEGLQGWPRGPHADRRGASL